MRSRRFLLSSAGLFLIVLVVWLPNDARAQDRAGVPSQPLDRTLDPDSPQAARLRTTLNDLLAQELTAHWYPHSVDSLRGGFHQSMARDWSLRPDDSASLVYQARMTWTAAAFARFSSAHRAEFAGYARHGIAFLDDSMRDKEQGGFHWIVGADGKLDPRLGDEKHVYGTAFVVYAASVVRQVTGDERALKVARDAFDWLEQHAHDIDHGGYFEAIRRDGTKVLAWQAGAPLWQRSDRLGVYYGFKSMNSHIHLLEALTELARVDDRPIVRDRLRETFLIVRDRIAVEPGALNLYLTPDWAQSPPMIPSATMSRPPTCSSKQRPSSKSPIESRTWQVARQLVDHALEWGWDDEYGGFYDKGESFGGAAFDQKKVWWTQAEGLNALLLMHRHVQGHTDRYARAFWKQWDFIEKHMIDQTHGGWYAETTRDGRLIGDGAKANAWKAAYHTSRALMNVVNMLDQPKGPGD